MILRVSKETAMRIAGGKKVFLELVAEMPSMLNNIRYLPTGATLCCARDKFCRIHYYYIKGSDANCQETVGRFIGRHTGKN